MLKTGNKYNTYNKTYNKYEKRKWLSKTKCDMKDGRDTARLVQIRTNVKRNAWFSEANKM